MVRTGLKLIAATGALRKIAFTTSVPVGEGLLDQIARRFEQPDTSFVITVGSPSRFRKLTVAVLDRGGKPIGFVKFPMTSEAAERITHESDFLEKMAMTPLSSVVPRVLFRCEYDSLPVLCVSSGPTKASGVRFGSQHRTLLQSFWKIRASEREAEVLVNEVAARVLSASEVLSPPTTTLLAEALEQAHDQMHSGTIECGLSHGDFAPWNLRTMRSGLFAFDWESAAWDSPNLWDIAHYDTQVVTLLGRKSQFLEITHGVPFSRGSYLLYLVHSVLNYVYELGEASRPAQDRLRLLKNSLED